MEKLSHFSWKYREEWKLQKPAGFEMLHWLEMAKQPTAERATILQVDRWSAEICIHKGLNVKV